MKKKSSLWNRIQNNTDIVLQSSVQTEQVAQTDSGELGKVLDYIIHNKSTLLTMFQENRGSEKIKNELLNVAREQFAFQGVDTNHIEASVKDFERYICGYHVLDELINDKDISDIKCYAYDHIRVKRLGKRMASELRFQSPEDYKRLISMIAAKNQVNISTLNAIQNFSDEEFSKDFILRFDICTEYINQTKLPMLQIRKFPKHKYTMQELIDLNVLTKEQAEYMERKVKESAGIFWTGKGGSGKTICMNACHGLVPFDKSVLIIQENAELSAGKHPDTHVHKIRISSGEGRVQYGLKELATNGLVLDVDYYILSEIKGSEAAEFAQASYTGHICWASGHGRSAAEGLYKLADNIKRATAYEYSECLRMLSSMEVVVFMKDFQVAEIVENKGYDEDKRRLIFEPVNLPIPLPRV